MTLSINQAINQSVFVLSVILRAFDFQSPPEKMNEDRCTQSATKRKANESSFYKFKICANIRWCSLEGAPNDSGVIESGDAQILHFIFTFSNYIYTFTL